MDLLINLPAVLNGKDLKAMRQLSDDIEAHMRALESLGCKPEQYGELFLPLLLNKIPKEIRLDICSKVSEKSWNFKSVLKQLNEELANRERCEIVAATKNPQEEHKRGNRGKYFGPKVLQQHQHLWLEEIENIPALLCLTTFID